MATNNGVNTLQMGVEDVVHEFLSLRAGYRAVYADTQILGLTGLSVGLGLQIQNLGIDYAYLPYGDLGTTHRISLNYAFGKTDHAPGKAS